MAGTLRAEPVAVAIGKTLRAKGRSLALAESCTGGLVGHLITQVPGSSNYLLGGIIAYADRVKQRQLGVRAETLARHGAVSRESALEMAWGARHGLGADVGLSVTGIAGPGGGSPEKPVGLTWMAVSDGSREVAARHLFEGGRARVKAQAAEAALCLLLEFLEAEE